MKGVMTKAGETDLYKSFDHHIVMKGVMTKAGETDLYKNFDHHIVLIIFEIKPFDKSFIANS